MKGSEAMKGRVFWQAAGRFSVAFAMAVAYAAAVCWQKAVNWIFGVQFEIMAMALLVGAGASVAAGLWGERWGWGRCGKWAGQAAAVALFVWCVVSGAIWEWKDAYFWTSRWLGALAAWAVAGWALAWREERVEVAAPRLAVAGATGVATWGVLALGTWGIGLALEELFGVPWRWEKCLLHFVGGPAVSLGIWLAVSMATKEETFAMPRAWRIVVKWVALPVCAVFTGVLLAYFGWCAVRWNLPRGQIAGFSATAGFAWIAVHLLLGGEEGRRARTYARWGGLAVLPLMALQVMALEVRIGEYGLTPARCGGLAAAGFVAVFCTAAAARPGWTARWGWALVAAWALAAGVSPWNVTELGVAAQMRRMEGYRERKAAGEAFDSQAKRAIWGTWDYVSKFERRGGRWRQVRRWPEGQDQFVDEWGFGHPTGRQWVESGGLAAANKPAAKTFGYHAMASAGTSAGWPKAGGGMVRYCELQGRDGRIVARDWRKERVDLTEELLRLFEERPGGVGVAWVEKDGVRFLADEIHIETDEEGRVKAAGGKGWLFETAGE